MRLLSAALIFVLSDLAVAADHAAALKEYLTDDVVAVAYLDLSSIDTLGVLEWVEQLGLVNAEERGAAVKVAMAAQQRLDELVDSGASHLYLLFRVSDVSHRGPSWVVPVANGGNPSEVLKLILSGLPDNWVVKAEVANGTVLGGTTMAQLEHLKNTRPVASRDLSDAWSALGQGDCGLVIFGDDDSRRVVREMFPPLPKPFAALDGELIADGFSWGGISLKMPPEPSAEIVVETQDAPTAATVAQAITSGLSLAKQALPVEQDLMKTLANAFRPQVEGARVRIVLDELTSDAQLLTKLLSPPIRAARQAAQRNQRMNRFKNIARAFNNYHDRQKSFPAQANHDDSGRPLLSWRVHLLPYLDQNALYNQFHLDEPWDSEHNRRLSATMPAIYADPDSALRRINAQGKTTFVVPVGDGTVFEGPEGTPIKAITDGTSNTIMLVEVVPERAVVWTKPEDWQVDFGDPLNGVKRTGRTMFSAAYCDGSVRSISNSFDESVLRAVLTMAGEEVVNMP